MRTLMKRMGKHKDIDCRQTDLLRWQSINCMACRRQSQRLPLKESEESSYRLLEQSEHWVFQSSTILSCTGLELLGKDVVPLESFDYPFVFEATSAAIPLERDSTLSWLVPGPLHMLRVDAEATKEARTPSIVSASCFWHHWAGEFWTLFWGI